MSGPLVHTVPISSITYDDSKRQRQDLDPESIGQLADSIAQLGRSTGSSGLLNPIILDKTNALIAGRRRLEAHKLLERTTIEARYFDDLSELERATIEFDENHKRKQLTWQEEASAIAHITKLTREASPLPVGIATIAESLGVSEGKVSEDLALAEAMENPRVNARPSRRGALTTMKRVRELELMQRLAQLRAAELGLDMAGGDLGGGRIYNEDCRDMLLKVAADSIDLIVTDPPWGVNLDQSTQWSKKFHGTYDDDMMHVQALLSVVYKELYRVLKPCSHAYFYFPIQDLIWHLEQLVDAGFIVRSRPLIWFKSGAHAMTDLYTSFRPTYESFLFAWKPGPGDVKRLFQVPIDDGYAFPRQPTEWHENEKPVEMTKRYIEASSSVGEIVLDPFAGGGSILAAAYETGRYYLGCELDPVHYAKTLQRMQTLEENKDGASDEG